MLMHDIVPNIYTSTLALHINDIIYTDVLHKHSVYVCVSACVSVCMCLCVSSVTLASDKSKW